MADQGCPNEGSDTRVFGRIGCWVQSRLSFKSSHQPASVLVAFPPYVSVNLWVPFAPAHRRYLHVRFGWRYDKYWPGYIFDPALKAKEIPILY